MYENKTACKAKLSIIEMWIIRIRESRETEQFRAWSEQLLFSLRKAKPCRLN